jgi:hypothetical protein
MFPASYRISREYAMTTNGTKKTQEIPTVIQVGHPFSVFPFRGKIPMAIKPQSMYPPSAPSAPLLRDAIATLTLKIGGGADPIVESQLPAGVRPIEATLDREREMRLNGGQRSYRPPRPTA